MGLVKEDNTPPLRWPLGRLMQVYPGKDELVRVVRVRMKGKLYKRPFLKLAPLPNIKEKNDLEKEIDSAYHLEESSHSNFEKQKKKNGNSE